MADTRGRSRPRRRSSSTRGATTARCGVSWHTEADLVVLSMWRENVCVGSFRLAVDEVPDADRLPASGLGSAYAAPRPAARPA